MNPNDFDGYTSLDGLFQGIYEIDHRTKKLLMLADLYITTKEAAIAKGDSEADAVIAAQVAIMAKQDADEV